MSSIPSLADDARGFLARFINQDPTQRRDFATQFPRTPPEKPLPEIAKAEGCLADDGGYASKALSNYVKAVIDRASPADRDRILSAIWRILVGDLTALERKDAFDALSDV